MTAPAITDTVAATSVQVGLEARRRRQRDAVAAYLFLSPQLTGLVVFTVGPLLFALVLAFTQWDGFGEITFVGFAHFTDMLTDPRIQRSALNTVWFTVLQVPGLMITALFFAWTMQRAGRMLSVYRLAFVAPCVTSTVAVAAIWLWLFNPQISPLSTSLRAIGTETPDWLQDPRFVIPAIAIVAIWQGVGYQVVMFMAGLQNISRAVMEAAELDGCTEWQKFRQVTLPMLSPTILFLSITSIIGSFQVFDYVYVLMGSDSPDAARTVVYEIVQLAFKSFEFGPASALAFLLFTALLALTGVQLFAQKRLVHYTE